MTSPPDNVLRARDAFADLYMHEPWFQGVGVGRINGEDWHVSVLTTDTDDVPALPAEIAGVRVQSRRTGQIVAQ